MKTQLILEDNVIKAYNFIVPLSKGDIIHLNGIQYTVDYILLDADEDIYQIFLA